MQVNKRENTIIKMIKVFILVTIAYSFISLYTMTSGLYDIREIVSYNEVNTIRFISIFINLMVLLVFSRSMELYKNKKINEAIVILTILLICEVFLQQALIIFGFILLIYTMVVNNKIKVKEVFSKVDWKDIKLELVFSSFIVVFSLITLFAYLKIR